jgi:hypothetical protein
MYASVIRSFTVVKHNRQRRREKEKKENTTKKKPEDSFLQANGRYRTEITIDFS